MLAVSTAVAADQTVHAGARGARERPRARTRALRAAADSCGQSLGKRPRDAWRLRLPRRNTTSLGVTLSEPAAPRRSSSRARALAIASMGGDSELKVGKYTGLGLTRNFCVWALFRGAPDQPRICLEIQWPPIGSITKFAAMTRPLILLSNDDGYSAPGLRQLRDALANFSDVIVCAPSTEQSATSHSISLNRPLRLWQPEPGIFTVDGTPADCVYVALHAKDRVLSRKPDLVVAGLNHGLNLGNDVFYSGTVAAAREGALRGVSAIAASASLQTDGVKASAVVARVAQRLIEKHLEETLLLNINFPPGDRWKVRPTELGSRVYQDGVHFRNDPRGGEYLWIGSGGVRHSGTEHSDTDAFDRGVVGVTPLSLQLWATQQQGLAAELVGSLGD